MTAKPDLLLLAEIVGVHGIKGTLKIKFFGENIDMLSKGKLCDATGAPRYEIARIAQHGNTILADFKDITDRTVAEKMRGTRLYVPRDILPKIKKKDTYYYADLIGLAAVHVDGSSMGKIIAVANFGAGDLLEVKPAKGNSYYVPFTNDIVPEVDIKKKQVTIDPPPGLLD